MCRAIFDRRFSVARMAAQYVSVYERIMARQHFDSPVGAPPCSTSYA
jgi:hypothetical protein